MLKKFLGKIKFIGIVTIINSGLLFLALLVAGSFIFAKWVKSSSYSYDLITAEAPLEAFNISSKTVAENFDGNGFFPKGPAGSEPNLPPGYKDLDYQNAAYSKDDVYLETTSSKIVSTGYVEIKVSSVSESLAKIKDLVVKYKAIPVSRDSKKNENGDSTGKIKIRLKPSSLDDFIKEISAIGEIIEQNISYENISDQYDKNKTKTEDARKLRRTYLQLLNKKNIKVEDILKIKKELNQISSKITELTDTKKHYDDWLKLSPMTIYLAESNIFEKNRNKGILQTLISGMQKMFYLFFDTISFLFAAIGILIPIFFISYFFFRYNKKLKTKRGK